jgi:hypothetical protein
MRCSSPVTALVAAVALALGVALMGCGDRGEQPAPAPTPTAPADAGAVEAQLRPVVGLDVRERARLQRKYSAEAQAEIDAGNAEAVGRQMLAVVERELAAERAAAGDAGAK